jgi:ubiquinone/menaquinone biosynthesis C-methylase UbiE
MSGDPRRGYFNELAAEWDRMPRPEGAESRVAAFCRRSCLPGSRLVLDAGCGTGILIPSLVELLGGGGWIVALDFAPAMLRQVGRKFPDRPILRVCADARALPFPGGLFDAVLCFGLLPHLGEVRRALEALWSVLRPGGVLAIGHLMGSRELNQRHQSIGGPVGEDLLPEASQVGAILRELGAAAVETEDGPGGYYVSGIR